MSIPTKWTNGIEDDKEEFNSKRLEQKVLFERLWDLVDEKEIANYKDRMKKEHYEKASWSELQADATGYARALSEMKFLLQFTKEK